MNLKIWNEIKDEINVRENWTLEVSCKLNEL